LKGEATYVVVSERLLDLLAGSDESEVNEGGNGYTGNSVVAELAHELEGEEEEVQPNSALGRRRSSVELTRYNSKRRRTVGCERSRRWRYGQQMRDEEG